VIHAGLRSRGLPHVARRAPLAALGATAAVVVAVDELSKALAMRLLPELETPTRFVQLGVLHNADLAWGLSAGAESLAVGAFAALVIVALSLAVCDALAAHDRSASVMLGLIIGAGVANATDALTPPAGVVDWIAIGGEAGIVLNLADVAVLLGLGLCARTVYRLVGAIRSG
jgi:lipoprotein signal peptidase